MTPSAKSPPPEAQERAARGRSAEAPPEEGAGLSQALAAGLDDVLLGFEVVDRELVFDEGGRADLVGVDASGRPVLVMVAGQDADRSALEVLDTLSYARRHASLLARHLRSPRLREGAETRLLLIQPSPDPRLLERLQPLLGRGLEVLGVRTLTSAGGERSYLVPLELPRPTALPRQARPGAAFLEDLAGGQRDLCRALFQRMRRLDDEVETDAGAAGILWSVHGETLAQVERFEGGVRGGVAPDFEPRRLTSERDVDRFVESSMSRLVQLLDSPGAEPRAEDPEADTAFLGEELLTAEEIAAFRGA